MYKPPNLEGKVAVAIGGTSGAGRVMALGLAEAGTDIVACSRTLEAAQPVGNQIEQTGRGSLCVAAEVGSRELLTAAQDAMLKTFRRVDILINSAAQIRRTPAFDLSEDEPRTLETSLSGTHRACQVFARPMVAQGWGRIANIALQNSFASFHEVPSYAARKAGVMGLTRSRAVEWGRKAANVNAMAPGIFRTNLNQALLHGTDRALELLARSPLGRFGRVNQ